MTPRESFVEQVRAVNRLCPCKDASVFRTPDSIKDPLCVCMIGEEQGCPCEWPGHAALRKAVVAFADAVCKESDAWQHSEICGSTCRCETPEAHDTCRTSLLAACGFGEDSSESTQREDDK